jgi:predicted transcriptional regulator
LEAEVLAALWAADAPLTPAALQAAVGGGLAYNTVHTILTRLHDKGLVVRVVHNQHRAYAPAKDAVQDAADRMRGVLEGRRDRAEILHRFVTSLSPAEERTLRSLLADDEAR